MDKIKILTNSLIGIQNKNREDILSITESPIEKIFLLCLLNYIEIISTEDFLSKIQINGYSYIYNNSELSIGEKAIGLSIIHCGSGAVVNYPKGIPFVDGTFMKLEEKNRYLRRDPYKIDSDESDNFSFIQKVLFYPQHQVVIDQICYRLDFAFLLYENINHKSELVKKVAIECDGQEYHSSSNQFKQDRERVRKLQKNDWDVIRFSGSQINKNLYNNYKEEFSQIFDSMGFGRL